MSFIKLSSIFCFLVVLLFTSPAWASKTALIYHSNYSDAHTNVKTQLEADGYTVTLSTTGTVGENLINSYDVVWDMKYNNSIGSNGKTRYQNFVQAGGVLVLVGENNQSYSNNNQTIEAFIENKLGGTVARVGNTSGCAYNCTNNNNSNTITTTNTDVTDSDYGSDVAVYPYGTYFTGDGTWVAKNGNGQVVWMRWSGDQLPSGYTGAAYITFDINQFQSVFDKAKMANLISDTYTSVTSTDISISSSQTTTKSTATSRTYNSNTIRITQSGSNLDLDIIQKGDNNFIEGSDFSSVATLTGDDLTITLEQGSSLGTSDNNGIGIDVNGDANTVMIRQGTMGNSDTGGHRAKVNVTGDTNSLTLYQYNDGGSTSNHFSHIDITGGQNTVTSYQRNNNSKDLFIDLDGSSNTISTDQKETGNHYLDLDVNGNGHTVTATQRGSGDHGARIDLTNSGGSSTVTLDQNSSTNQNYTLTQDCTNSSGCSTSVTQN